MKFRNTETGNILETNNGKTIALMNGSDRYEAVSDAPKKKSLDRMNVDELTALAAEKGIDISACENKAAIVALLKTVE